MAELKDKFKKEDNKYSHKREKPLVISIDQDGKILHLNKECERLFGYSRKEVLNKKLSDFLITKHNLQKLDDLIKLAMKDELIDNFQIPFPIAANLHRSAHN